MTTVLVFLGMLAAAAFSFGLFHELAFRWWKAKLRFVVADTLADGYILWLWSWYPRRLRLWLWDNAELTPTHSHSLFRLWR
jgi:hypothetical protein